MHDFLRIIGGGILRDGKVDAARQSQDTPRHHDN
jgi:hypothetical protein